MLTDAIICLEFYISLCILSPSCFWDLLPRKIFQDGWAPQRCWEECQWIRLDQEIFPCRHNLPSPTGNNGLFSEAHSLPPFVFLWCIYYISISVYITRNPYTSPAWWISVFPFDRQDTEATCSCPAESEQKQVYLIPNLPCPLHIPPGLL